MKSGLDQVIFDFEFNCVKFTVYVKSGYLRTACYCCNQ